MPYIDAVNRTSFMRGIFINLVFILLVFSFSHCSQTPARQPLLEQLSADKTGIRFSNEIRESKDLNILSFEYFYNGSGVGVGDFNQDGLPDIFFSSNMGKSRLYLNQNNLTFSDITDSSGIVTEGKWATGVSIVDINQDGFPDIYLCYAGPHTADKRANELYINNKNNSFTEKAAAYGLADTGHSVQATFFDYDRDGDLDMYLLTNITDETGPNVIRPKRNHGEMANTDRLYRNNGNETFSNVSTEAGITHEGYGLGVAVVDIDQNGWPDIFVSNDYLSNDLLYLNNKNGGFSEVSAAAFKHTSYSAMGNDVADINNDGMPDIIEVDMLPPDNYRWKMMLGSSNTDRYRSEIQYGYAPQFMRNSLQLNRGVNASGIPFFSEIGQLAGIAATDWSWSPLFADLDNDGWKDLFITNGYPRDITNRDFISYDAQSGMQMDGRGNLEEKRYAALQKLDGALLHNFVFQNRHDLRFADSSAGWGITEIAYSSGAAYADLDNDGDLDLIAVNTGKEAAIYRNNANDLRQHHYLRIALSGPKGNRDGFGARLCLFAGGQRFYQEMNPARGYQSTVDQRIHFGLGNTTKIDSLVVIWPDAVVNRFHNLEVDKQQLIQYQSAAALPDHAAAPLAALFESGNEATNIQFKHRESPYTDFNIQPLIPHKFSQSGPGIAVGDMNGDGRDDFFIGGAYHQSGELFFQQNNGTFISSPLDTGKKGEEDMGALLFDADGDNDLDLYVVSGGNEMAAGSPYYQDRLYLNDSRGKFAKDLQALPKETASGSCVVATDFDADGDLDLFVGGKITPQHYPAPGYSMLLENRGGQFVDVTDQRAPGLKNIGMVNAAIWSDVNNDQLPDLVLAGEWMPITVFVNQGKGFTNQTQQLGLSATVGWWNSIQAADIDSDGHTDFILGNLGLNSRYTTSATEPLRMYVNDFAKIGTRNIILTHSVDGIQYPIHPRDDLLQQLPGLRKKFSRYEQYAKASITELFDPVLLSAATISEANSFQSSWLQNKGKNGWQLRPLSIEAQFSPVFGILCNDYNNDGYDDLLLSGNFYAAEVINGPYDAGQGVFLAGNGKGDFKAVENGFRINGDGKGLAELMVQQQYSLILAAQNDDSLICMEIKSKSQQVFKAAHIDAYALIKRKDGSLQKKEFYYGSGYLSSSGRYLHIPADAVSVEIITYQGKRRLLPLLSNR